MIRDYCKAAGFYSYDAASDNEDPVSHWIGREVKKFLADAPLHLPFLLHIAAAPADCIAEMAACANDAGEQEMDDDDEYTPTEEQVLQEELEEPAMMQIAECFTVGPFPQAGQRQSKAVATGLLRLRYLSQTPLP